MLAAGADPLMKRAVFLGLDVGTQGARAVALDEIGRLVASARRDFQDASPQEQSPDMWWDACLAVLRAVGATLAGTPELLAVALSVTSTSGTVIPIDDRQRPLHAALMYADKRSAEQAKRIAAIAPELGANSSWGLPKILWYREEHPETAARIAAWRHAGDLILGRLTGRWDVTDVTSALKTGYDPVAERWPAWIEAELGVPGGWLPRVAPSGTLLGTLLPDIAAKTGLPASIEVTTGMTDGCASQVATGAVRPGDWTCTIGTTLVIKGVTTRPIADPSSGVYSHRHPDGGWMPGGASNTGGEWIARDYAGTDLEALDWAAAALIPTDGIAYPLRQQGERFPFVCPGARGFDPPGFAGAALYAARLEGTAYLERLALERLERLAGEPVRSVYAAGGGSRSDLWLRIRAAVLGRPVAKARNGEGAVGAAVIAAAGTRFGSLGAAAASLTGIEATIEPGAMTVAYEEGYRRFVAALRDRGYLAS